jgi:hypothetical protein
MCGEEVASFLRMLLGYFTYGPGERFDDHVVAVCGENGTDSCDFLEVVRLATPTECDRADERGASPPAVWAARPYCYRFVGEPALGPHWA